MLLIKVPNNNEIERKYIISIIIGDFLGLEYKVINSSSNYEIILPNKNNILIEDVFFYKFQKENEYLNNVNIPNSISISYNQFAPEGDIPVVFGRDDIIINSNEIKCGIDIFASAFFMLTRWEEVVSSIRDKHDRFPSTASLAYKCDFLNRPIVNEYVEMLWNMLFFLDKSLKRKERHFRFLLSHDVDNPFFYLNQPIKNLLKYTLIDLKKTLNPVYALKNIVNWFHVKNGDLQYDKFNTFDFIINESNKRGLSSAFYFLPTSSKDLSIKYFTSTLQMQDLLCKILNSGHEVGIHGHYETYLNEKIFLEDVKTLRTDLENLGVKQSIVGGRQHFLRWKTPDTMRNYESADLKYDTSLSYADRPGFRCGICYEFPFFDVENRKILNIRERPLIVMECTIIHQNYMNLGYSNEAFNIFKSLKQTCKKFNGDFTLLWHNSFLVNDEDKMFYLKVLDS